MQYKTIILELIRQNEPLHDRLKGERKLLATVERLALELRTSHLEHLQLVGENRSAAFETALAEMEARLRPGSPDGETAADSLDPAMAFVRNRSPSA